MSESFGDRMKMYEGRTDISLVPKIPVIGSSAGEIPNVIAEAGLIFEQKNVGELKECLRQLMKDPTLRRKHGEEGFKRVMGYYTHDVIASSTYTFWKDILK